MTDNDNPNIGDAIWIYMDYTDGNGNPANPTTLTWRVLKPSGVISALTPQSIATGRYKALVLFTEAGRWQYHLATDNAFGVVEEPYIDVKRSAFS